jgi:hypothetical protein
MSANKISEVDSLFEKNLEEFVKNIDSLKSSLSLTMGLISITNKISRNKTSQFIRTKAKKKTSKSFYLKYEDINYYEKLKRDLDISNTSIRVVPRSTLISLVSQFDAFMGSIIKIVFILYPEILNTSQKNLTFSSLSNFDNINEIKNYIIEKEIDSVLRENHTYHFEWLEEKLKMPLRKDLPIWGTFVELTERRNLFAHCGGKISSQYISICKENRIEINKDYKVGYELYVTSQYLESSYKCLYELAVKLTHVIWRKLRPKDLSNADQDLNKICYNLIDVGSYTLADTLLEFATNTIKNHFDGSSLNFFIINKALSKKLGGDKKAAHEIINKQDWSHISSDFNLAKEVLLGNDDKVFLLMKKIGKKSEYIDKTSYRNWPLFKDLRKNKNFQETFKQIYKEEFELKEN